MNQIIDLTAIAAEYERVIANIDTLLTADAIRTMIANSPPLVELFDTEDIAEMLLSIVPRVQHPLHRTLRAAIRYRLITLLLKGDIRGVGTDLYVLSSG